MGAGGRTLTMTDTSAAALRPEHVDPHRRVFDVVGQRVADVLAHTLAVQADVEQLASGGVEPSQMEVDAERAPASDLHRGEVPGRAQIERPDLLQGGGLAVTFQSRIRRRSPPTQRLHTPTGVYCAGTSIRMSSVSSIASSPTCSGPAIFTASPVPNWSSEPSFVAPPMTYR